MKKYFYAFLVSCILCGCTRDLDTDLIKLPASKTARSFKDRLIVDSSVLKMLLSRQDFHELCAQVNSHMNYFSTNLDDDSIIQKMHPIFKELDSTYQVFNIKYDIDNIQTYIDYHKNNYKPITKTDPPDIDPIPVDANITIMWNKMTSGFNGALALYIDSHDFAMDFKWSMEYEYQYFHLFKYWHEMWRNRIYNLNEEYRVIENLNYCGILSNYHIHINTIMRKFIAYVMLYPPPNGTYVPPTGGTGGGGTGGDSGSGGGWGGDPDPDPDNPPHVDYPCGDEKCPVCHKCIRSSNGSCDDCQCPIRLTIYASDNDVDVMEEYTITAIVIGDNIPADLPMFIVIHREGAYFKELGRLSANNDKLTVKRKSLNPGKWEIMAVASLDSKLYTSDTIVVHERFPPGSSFLTLSHIETHLKNTLWPLSENYARANSATHSVREFGCFIYLNSNGEYYCGPTIEGDPVTLTSVGVHGELTLDEGDQYDIDNANRTTPLAVGTMHTHYPLTWAGAGFFTETGPSSADIQSVFPWIVYDYTIPELQDGHNISLEKSITQYGVLRRATW